MIETDQAIHRLEKLLHRFSDSPEEANVALATFQRTMANEGLKAVDLRLELDNGQRSSADALLRAFDKINTPTKQKIQELESKVHELERANSKLRAELKVKSEEVKQLRSIKRNYDRSKTRRADRRRKPKPAKKGTLL
jgi:hypothetical protein